MTFLRKISASLDQSPLRESCAEFLATFCFVLCGTCVSANVALTPLKSEGVIVGAIGWGLALSLGVAIAGRISGGHCNPAVTTGLAAVRKCSWKNVPFYIASQYLASFLAAVVTFSIYYDAIDVYDMGHRQVPPSQNSTAQIFATFPQAHASVLTCFFDQVIGTALLLVIICAATDLQSKNVPVILQALVIGLGLTAIALALGFNCGGAFNPARDLGPRIFTAVAGYGIEPFRFNNYKWFWIPVVGPHLGGVLGAFLYQIFARPPRNYETLNDTQAANMEEGRSHCSSETSEEHSKSLS